MVGVVANETFVASFLLDGCYKGLLLISGLLIEWSEVDRINLKMKLSAAGRSAIGKQVLFPWTVVRF